MVARCPKIRGGEGGLSIRYSIGGCVASGAERAQSGLPGAGESQAVRAGDGSVVVLNDAGCGPRAPCPSRL